MRRNRALPVGSLVGTLLAGALGLTACTSSGSSSATHTPGASVASSPTQSAPIASGSMSSRHASPTKSHSPLPKSDPAPLTTVATKPAQTRAAVPLSSPAPFGNGVTARVTAITHGTDHDRGPGAAYGRPTVVFHLRLTNGSRHALSVATVQVNASYGSSKSPAIAATSSTVPFAGTVRPGRSADGVYAFAVPRAAQGAVQLTVTYTAGRPTVLLTGSAR